MLSKKDYYQRLSKFLAYSGISSRRKSESLILSGQISVNGVVVTAVKRDSFAAKAGLNVGTVISQISQTIVKNPSEVKKLLEGMKKKGADAALIQVFENNFSRFIILKLK